MVEVMELREIAAVCTPGRMWRGEHITKVFAALPQLLDALDEAARMQERVERLEAALREVHGARLRRGGEDPGYGWNITKLNKAMNAALPLIGREPPKWDGKLADRAEPAERMARTMGAHFEIDPKKVSALAALKPTELSEE